MIFKLVPSIIPKHMTRLNYLTFTEGLLVPRYGLRSQLRREFLSSRTWGGGLDARTHALRPCVGADFGPQPARARGLDFLLVAVRDGVRARIRQIMRGGANDHSCGADAGSDFQPAQFGHCFISFVPVSW